LQFFQGKSATPPRKIIAGGYAAQSGGVMSGWSIVKCEPFDAVALPKNIWPLSLAENFVTLQSHFTRKALPTLSAGLDKNHDITYARLQARHPYP
ncbi:MAG: hypothetical protein J1E29_08700, partial [Duncaniella sp.]|nr:hypothetical protein [Duncaniella sp.]